MINQNASATRLKEYVTALLPCAHGHQLNAISGFVAAIMDKQTASQAALARSFGNQEAATRRLSRLLHNPRLSSHQLADALLNHVLRQLPRRGRLRLALGWTIQGPHHLLVVSLVCGARAFPIYWRAYSATLLKGRMRRYERAVIKRVVERLRQVVGRRRLILTADRWFADVELAQLLEKPGVDYVIRVKCSTKVWSAGQWRQLQEMRFVGNSRGRNLGRLWYCAAAPHRLYVTMTRARNEQGQGEIWYLMANRFARAVQAASEYARRFGCEHGFRDSKWQRGFAEAHIRQVQAWSRMFALIAISLLIVVQLAMKLLVRGQPQAFTLMRQVASRRRGRWDVSIVSAMVHLLRLHRDLFDHLCFHSKLSLEIALPNVS
jgi:Transposase DDE domain